MIVKNKMPTIQIPQIVRNSLHWSRNQPPFLPKPPSILATNLIKSYFDKGLVLQARQLFDEMPDRDVITWTAMISGYSFCRDYFRSWVMFRDMMRECGDGVNGYSLSSVLKACKGMRNAFCCDLVHGLGRKCGLVGNLYVGNGVLDVYATCCVTMKEAKLVFDEIGLKNSVSWTTLITGYTHRGHGYSGIRAFKRMLLDQGEVSDFSFSIVAKASASIFSDACGRQIHALVIKHGFDSNIPIMNSIIDMYCRCNCLSEASDCFHGMIEKDLITWNTLISGYEKSNSSESIYIFSQMEREGFIPNTFTFSSVLAGCANLAVLSCGQQVHAGVTKRGFLDDMPLSNSLIDMYAKCGNMVDARKIFCQMSDRDLVSWTSMMIGYGNHGHGKEAIELFEMMILTGIKPDQIVFMAVLGACSHGGLVDEGLRYFNLMTHEHNISPNREIYGCVIDLLGRAGRVREAYELIESMPFKPDESIWGAYLGACKAHKVPNLGKLVVERILESGPNMTGTYMMLSNIYAAEGNWGEFAKLRKMMKGMASKKEAGRSWIEVGNQVHSFVSGDKMGMQIEWAYEVLAILVQHMAEGFFVPDMEYATIDLEYEQNGDAPARLRRIDETDNLLKAVAE